MLLSSVTAGPVVQAEPVAGNGHPAITVVESESGGHYAELANALRETLSAQGARVSIVDAATPYQGSSLVIGIGMKAAKSAAASAAPLVLNVLIPKAGHDQLLRDFPLRAQAHTLSAIYLDQPVERQVELIAAAFPASHDVGLLYSSPPAEIARLRKAMASHGLVLHEKEMTPALDLADELHDLLRHISVLLALPDPAIYNSSTIRNLLLATYRAEIPLVGISPGYVKAGALCAVSSTPGQIARQAAMLVSQLAATGSLPDARYPEDFEVWVNDQVADSLGIRVGAASALRDRIKAAERKAQ